MRSAIRIAACLSIVATAATAASAIILVLVSITFNHLIKG